MISNHEQNLEEGPFKILHNYRSTSTRSSRVSKKHPIRKTSEHRIQIPLKKPRKMTEHLQVENHILQEENIQLEERGAYSEVDQPKGQKFDLENGGLWGSSDLQRGIPFDFQESVLDYESPLEMSSYKGKNMFEGEE